MTPDADYRPYSGSCPRCLSALDLASIRVGDSWYCCAACARGESPEREPAVAEQLLTNRPRRFFGRRTPKELRAASPERASTL